MTSGLDETLAGRGRLVFLVSGEPGIGKTRLADEFAAVAEAKGLAVRVRHCLQEAVPFLPFVEMLERFVDGIAEPEQLRRQLAEEASELARLLPKLRRILPDLPPALDLPALQARRHLFNADCLRCDRKAGGRTCQKRSDPQGWRGVLAAGAPPL